MDQTESKVECGLNLPHEMYCVNFPERFMKNFCEQVANKDGDHQLQIAQVKDKVQDKGKMHRKDIIVQLTETKHQADTQDDKPETQVQAENIDLTKLIAGTKKRTQAQSQVETQTQAEAKGQAEAQTQLQVQTQAQAPNQTQAQAKAQAVAQTTIHNMSYTTPNSEAENENEMLQNWRIDLC